jgi:single-strand DNA-binding protein
LHRLLYCIVPSLRIVSEKKSPPHPAPAARARLEAWGRIFFGEKFSVLHECNVQRCCQKREKGRYIAPTINNHCKQFKSIIMATLTGRVTRDARLVKANGKTFIAFDFVENDSYKKKNGEKVKQSFYFSCAMRNANGLLEHITKGKILTVTGNISARAYEDKQGDTKASTNVSVKNITFHGGGESSKTKAPIEQPPITNPVDDLPF